MSVLYIALPLALLLGGAAVVACVACIRGGQYDDLDAESVRILIEPRPNKSAPAPTRAGRNEADSARDK